jgi:alanine racemase
MTRPTRARIDLDALAHNYDVAKRLHAGKALAVLKANAYGHGAIRCAEHLAERVDGFAVAFFEEAKALRLSGIQKPILVLEGVFDETELTRARELRLWLVVHHELQLQMLERLQSDLEYSALDVWLKVDTGMGRAGFAPHEVEDVHRRLRTCTNVADITLMTHFSRADEPAEEASALQVKVFDEAVARLPGPRSLCNSAGLLAWPQARRDWARPGILLYGADPMPRPFSGVLPVMSLESTVFAVRSLKKGDPLGYGGGFVAQGNTRVGLVAIGYADGYPRTAPTGTPVLVDGRRSRLIGRVSMDMLTVDLTPLPCAGVGSRVELWGRGVDVNVVAMAAGTISYELLCNVKRVPLQYESKAITAFENLALVEA